MNFTRYHNRPYLIAQVSIADEDSFLAFQQESGLSAIAAKVLWQRGIHTLSDLRQLHAGEGELSDPRQLPDLDRVITLLEDIRRLKRRIRVYGDYDADGVSATALMYRGLQWAGFQDVDYYIPNRFDEGYGLHPEAVLQAVDDGIEVLITVDCGSSSTDAAALAAEHGLILIITDHHGLPPVLPLSAALVNPERMTHPNRLSGVGVALQVLRALIRKPLPDWAYGVAAVGTVADVVPLTGDNRRIVQHGMRALQDGAVPGISALLGERIQVNQPVRADDLGFFVGPHLNAAGRMGDATGAVSLLLASSREEAQPWVQDLREKNQLRKEIERQMVSEAWAHLTQDDRLTVPDFVVLAQDNWHHGVIGIVASRIKDMLRRPVAIIGWENGEGKGSARGMPGLHLLNHMARHRGRFIKLGGHRGACGFSLVKQDPYELSLRLSELMPADVLSQQYTATMVDSRINAQDVTPRMIEELRNLEPFGHGFERPRLAVTGRVASLRTMGSDHQHLALTLQDTPVRVVAFNHGFMGSSIESTASVEFVGEMLPNFYRGREEYQWRVEKWVGARAVPGEWMRRVTWEPAPEDLPGRIIYVVNNTRDQRRLSQETGAIAIDHHWDYGTRLIQEERLRTRPVARIVINQWGLWPSLDKWAHHIVWISAPAGDQCLVSAAALLDMGGTMWIDPTLSAGRILNKAERLAPSRRSLALLWRAWQHNRKPLLCGQRIFEELELRPGARPLATRRDLRDSPSYQRAQRRLQNVRASWQNPLHEWGRRGH